MIIRRLTGADAEDFRAIRLEALERHPDVFGTLLSDEAARDRDYFVDRLQTDAIFGGYHDEALQGIVGFAASGPGKQSHAGTLYGMYVRPSMRGTGIARALFEAALRHAETEVEIVRLRVVLGNEPALALYARCGFIIYGIDRRSMKVDGSYIDEALMVRRFVDC